ncbi:MAG: bifunctional folylpolyglutamate synthase/ dihydrofolate synthase, partial [Candidatus Poseidoniaceae archaeon]
PHLVRIEERIRLDGRPIPAQQFDAYLNDIMEIESSMNEQLTFFEITFLVACLFASRNDVDVFIVETGLGGRYDAT